MPVGNTKFIVINYDFYRILKKTYRYLVLLNLFQQTIGGGCEINLR
jgi:hypothetical protein